MESDGLRIARRGCPVERLIQQLEEVDACHATQAEAVPQEHVLAVRAPLEPQILHARVEPISKGLHPPSRYDLEGPVKPVLAVVQVQAVLRAEPLVLQMVLESARKEDAVGIHLDRPVVLREQAVLENEFPDAREDLGVQGGAVGAALLHLEGALHDVRDNLLAGDGVHPQMQRLPAEHVVAAALKDAGTLRHRVLHEGNLVAACHHQGNAVEVYSTFRGSVVLAVKCGRGRLFRRPVASPRLHACMADVARPGRSRLILHHGVLVVIVGPTRFASSPALSKALIFLETCRVPV
mmetsp:Transcript_48656/g.126271  ORF Transcript_48656/g.126271 Transcript_48656/m.126271 type:complete len:294 (+) Transcript_48656:120-1001(+)